MWPYAVGAAVIAFFAIGASASTSSGTGAMVFKDYQWLVFGPSTTHNELSMVLNSQGAQLFPGTQDAAQIANWPPPPNCQPGSGQWIEYPGGYQSSLGTGIAPDGNRIQAPGTPGNPIIPVFRGVAAGQSVYAWRPTQDVLTILNGFAVMHMHWVFEQSDARKLAGVGGILQYDPRWHTDDGKGNIVTPPPPPGQSASSGSWHGPAPGYIVWLTPATAQQQAA